MNIIINEGLAFALPLFIIAIAGIYSEKSGIINLALEGLLGFGVFAGSLAVTLITIKVSKEVWYLPYLAYLFAILGGTLYSMLHAFLCIKLKANQVISGVVVNILSVSLTSFLVSQINSSYFRPSDKFDLGIFRQITIKQIQDIPILGGIFGSFYPFQIVIIIVSIWAYYLLNKSKFGLHLRACGENPNAVDSCGINVASVRFKAIMISGGLCAIGGMSFAYSIFANFSPGIYFGAGYLAVAALIFGNWKILPTLYSCLIFGMAKAGAYRIVNVLKLPSSYNDLAMMLPYILTLIILIFFSKSNQVPRALGEIYDKSKR